MRVRKRGGWLALGSVSDADHAKRLALAMVGSVPYKNKPPELPLNLVGGKRWPKRRSDAKTLAKVVATEIAGVREASADIIPARDDSESLNICGEDPPPEAEDSP